MGKSESRTSHQELLLLHAALLRQGKAGILVPVKTWESLLVQCLGTMTRQSCQDKTWAMERLGLIERREREGVIVLEARPEEPVAVLA
jgi:hypothetical protein